MSEINDPFYIVLKEVSQKLVNYLSPYIDAKFEVGSCLSGSIRAENISIFSVTLYGDLPEIGMRISVSGMFSNVLYNGSVSNFREEMLINFHIKLREMLNRIPNYIEEDIHKYVKHIEHYEKKAIVFNALLEHFPEEEKD